MRSVKRVSAAFLLLDGRTGAPVTAVTALADGSGAGCVRKGDGHIVFVDLPPGPHTFELAAPGYRPVRRTIPARTGLLPEVVILQYDADSPGLSRVPHFRLRCTSGGIPVPERRIRVELTTDTGGLRVIEKAAAGDGSILLSSFQPGLLYRPFSAPTGEELLITGRDGAGERCLLRRPLEKELGPGAVLRPVWELETDRNGTAILPYVGALMPAGPLSFAVSLGDARAELYTQMPRAETVLKAEL